MDGVGADVVVLVVETGDGLLLVTRADGRGQNTWSFQTTGELHPKPRHWRLPDDVLGVAPGVRERSDRHATAPACGPRNCRPLIVVRAATDDEGQQGDTERDRRRGSARGPSGSVSSWRRSCRAWRTSGIDASVYTTRSSVRQALRDRRRATRWVTRREGEWWTAWDSNPRPPRCERGALPAELAAPVCLQSGKADRSLYNTVRPRTADILGEREDLVTMTSSCPATNRRAHRRRRCPGFERGDSRRGQIRGLLRLHGHRAREQL